MFKAKSQRCFQTSLPRRGETKTDQPSTNSHPSSTRRNQMKAGAFLFLWPGVFRFRFVSLPQIVGKFVKKEFGHRHSAIIERITDDDSVRHHLFHVRITVDVSRGGLNLNGR